nr:MAG TPA: hypothetical protein [Caudoviricetes sp.]
MINEWRTKKGIPYDCIVPKVRNLRHRIFPPSHGDDKAVAR